MANRNGARASRGSSSPQKRQSVVPTAPGARTLTAAKRGVATSLEFKIFMSSLMSDLIEGKVAAQIGNAACNAGGKLLKIVEMEYKYGRTGQSITLATRSAQK